MFMVTTANAMPASITWVQVCTAQDVPANGGVCVKVNDLQIAVFNFSHTNQWYATQNLCPHRRQMALSRGLVGAQQHIPKVACPFHKKAFSLQTGECLNDETCASITTYPIKEEGGNIFIGLSSN